MAVNAADVVGHVAGQLREFTDNALYPSQSNGLQLSAAVEAEWYWSWNKGSDSIAFRPFLRGDSEDGERSHGDIRELFWLHAADTWEFGVGVGKVFWGVTESQHLVDIINQTDLVESPDGEDKLGQPMIRFAFIRDWGVVELFWLPYFRPRTFPGVGGRLRSSSPIDKDEPLFESSAEEHHQDFAVRWSHAAGPWDWGVSWFDGTAREPTFVLGTLGMLTPYYPQIARAGVDAQLTAGSLLWKLEGTYQDSRVGDFAAAVGGFEYTFVGLGGSFVDLGWLVEYSWDSRGKQATTGFQNDWFLGGRLTLNDEASTELLLGVVRDGDFSGSYGGFLEASRRLGEATKIYLEARFFGSDDPLDPLFQIRRDSLVELTIEYYF